jgi:two-component system chemotaxis response regulator CheY
MAKVLVVDDAAFIRHRLKKLLSDHGFDVMEASDGLEAVAQYRQSPADAVLMDMTMPEMDGITALKEIRKTDPEARIAMVTAMGQQGLVLEAMRAGAKDYVIKPFDDDRVLAAVRKLLA